MTELENRLLTLFQRLEQTQQAREAKFGPMLSHLTTQLNASSAQLTALSAHVSDLAKRIEHLQTALNKR